MLRLYHSLRYLCEINEILLMVVIMPKMQMGMGMRFFIVMIMMVGMYQIYIEQ